MSKSIKKDFRLFPLITISDNCGTSSSLAMSNQHQETNRNLFHVRRVNKRPLPETSSYIPHVLMVSPLRSQTFMKSTSTKIRHTRCSNLAQNYTLIPFTIISILAFYITPQILLSANAAAVSPTNIKFSEGQLAPSAVETETNIVEDADRFNPNECSIYKNEELHSLMDRVCELCHDMYSHQNPNMRADCRSKCFSTGNFKKCLGLFKPPSRTVRQIRSRRYFY